MKTVLLEKFFLEDLNLSSLYNTFPNLTEYETTKNKEIYNRCKDADIILTNKCLFDQAMLKKLVNVKFIQIMATGTNCVDVEYAKTRGIVVKNIIDYSTESVATYILTSIFNLLTSIPSYIADTKKGKWQNAKGFTFLSYPIQTLRNKRLGIIGYGNIGKKVESMAIPLGMKVLIAKGTKNSYKELRYSLNDILKESDIVLITCPLTKKTHHLISLKELEMMKPSAFLINAARGSIINEMDLLEALDKRLIAGAACDVLSKEPPSDSNPLLKCNHEKLYITPHIAWASISSRQELLKQTIANGKEFIENFNG